MKLKLNTGGTPATPSDPNASTPTPGVGLKLKFKAPVTAGSPPPSVATATVPAASSATPKTLKIKKEFSSKKRARDDDDDDDGEPSVSKPKKSATTATIRLGGNKSSLIGKSISLKSRAHSVSTVPSAARVKIKVKGKIPPRPLGVGYDSEAEGAEEDPAIEEHFVLRMMPGEDCDYLRKAIEERKIGVPIREGGADVGMRFFRSDGRRAVVNIKGTYYAAALVDLPCIVETMKSWDKRGWWKSADICQMLYVFRKVKQEDDARHCPLPTEVNERTWQWPHGLTPPMYNVRKRRFRKRVSHRTIEAAEAEVERLLEQDRKCLEMRGRVENEILDTEQMRRDEQEDEEIEYDDEQDAEGEPDDEAVEDPDLFASLVDMLDREETGPEVPASAAIDQSILANAADAPTPTVEAEVLEAIEDTMITDVDATGATEGEEEEESDEDEDDDDDAEDEEEDDDARAKAQELAQQREEVEYLEKELAMQREAYTKQANPLLKRRLADKLKNLEADLQIKKRALGITDDDA